jgi:anti-anti-sigma factor
VAIVEAVLDPSTDPRLSIKLEVPPAPAPVRIVLAGELDGGEVTGFATAVARLPSDGDGRDLRVDAAGLTFIDSAGIRALLTFRERAETSGVRVVLDPVTSDVYRVMQIAGLVDLLATSNPAVTD